MSINQTTLAIHLRTACDDTTSGFKHDLLKKCADGKYKYTAGTLAERHSDTDFARAYGATSNVSRLQIQKYASKALIQVRSEYGDEEGSVALRILELEAELEEAKAELEERKSREAELMKTNRRLLQEINRLQEEKRGGNDHLAGAGGRMAAGQVPPRNNDGGGIAEEGDYDADIEDHEDDEGDIPNVLGVQDSEMNDECSCRCVLLVAFMIIAGLCFLWLWWR